MIQQRQALMESVQRMSHEQRQAMMAQVARQRQAMMQAMLQGKSAQEAYLDAVHLESTPQHAPELPARGRDKSAARNGPGSIAAARDALSAQQQQSLRQGQQVRGGRAECKRWREQSVTRPPPPSQVFASAMPTRAPSVERKPEAREAPREVDYTPYTVQDYREDTLNPKSEHYAYWALGSLGPAETEETAAKRVQVNKVRGAAGLGWMVNMTVAEPELLCWLSTLIRSTPQG